MGAAQAVSEDMRRGGRRVGRLNKSTFHSVINDEYRLQTPLRPEDMEA